MAYRSIFTISVIPCIAALLFASPLAAADFSGNVAATSDYVFRGISQTGGKPALQAGAKIAFDSGFYAALWTSNVDYGDTLGSDAELDNVIGWSGKLGKNWTADVNLIRYNYPGTHAPFDIDYNELVGTFTWKSMLWATLGYSTNAYATGASGTYVQAGVRVPINDAFHFELNANHYFLHSAYGRDYSFAQVSAIYDWKKVELRVSGYATDGNAGKIFGDINAGSRVEFAASCNF